MNQAIEAINIGKGSMEYEGGEGENDDEFRSKNSKDDNKEKDEAEKKENSEEKRDK